MVNMLIWAGFAGLIFVVYLLYEFVYNDMIKKRKGSLVRVFLHEKVGNDIVFLGIRIAEDKKDDVIGNYLKLRKEKIGMERISNDDFINDREYGKCLHVVKFAPDDYRPMVRLRGGGNWFRREERQVTVTEVFADPDNPEETMNVETPKVDENGSPVMQEFEVEYDEPLGIGKDDRQAMRFNLSYRKRMDELFGEKKGLWEKLAMPIAVTIIAMVLFMSFGHMTNKHAEVMDTFAVTFGEESASFYERSQDPGWIESWYQDRVRNERESEAPPK